MTVRLVTPRNRRHGLEAKGKRELKAWQPSLCHTSSSSLRAHFVRNQWGKHVNRVHGQRFRCTRRDCKILAQEPGREGKDMKEFLLLHSTIKTADGDKTFRLDARLWTGNLFLHIYL